MKYYIGPQGWEVRHPSLSRRFIERGTLVDHNAAEWAFVVSQGPPIDAIAADQECYNAMTAMYLVYRVQYFVPAGIVPAAGAMMPAWYWQERYNDGSPVVKRPGA
jgi:hypothetical protein